MWKVGDQLRNDSYNAGLDQCGDDEKWLNSRHILMLKSIGLLEGLKWGVKVKEKPWLTPRFWTSAVRRLQLPLTEEGKTMKGVGFGRDSQELRVEYINTELPISHPNKEVN